MKHWIRFLPWIDKHPKLQKLAGALESLYAYPELLTEKNRFIIEEKITKLVIDNYNSEIVIKAKELADQHNIKISLHHESVNS